MRTEIFIDSGVNCSLRTHRWIQLTFGVTTGKVGGRSSQWLTLMPWGCCFRFPDGIVPVSCLCPLVFLHLRHFSDISHTVLCVALMIQGTALKRLSVLIQGQKKQDSLNMNGLVFKKLNDEFWVLFCMSYMSFFFFVMDFIVSLE